MLSNVTPEEWIETANLLRRNAAWFRLDAIPGIWPEWMTPEKRRSMADNFEASAAEIELLNKR